MASSVGKIHSRVGTGVTTGGSGGGVRGKDVAFIGGSAVLIGSVVGNSVGVAVGVAVGGTAVGVDVGGDVIAVGMAVGVVVGVGITHVSVPWQREH